MKFSEALKAQRTSAGLRQSELAKLCGLTGSYISLLESGKKPPPSSKVVVRIARALGQDPAPLLELAGLDRVPENVKKKVENLEIGLRRQRRLNRQLVRNFMPLPLLSEDSAPAIESILRGLGKSSEKIRAFLSRILKPGPEERSPAGEQQVIEYLESLSDEEREALLDALGSAAHVRGAADAHHEAFLPVHGEVPTPPAITAADRAAAMEPVPACWFSETRYFFAARDDSLFPRVERGDLLLADESVSPRSGDIVLAFSGASSCAAKYIDTGEAVELSVSDPNVPPQRFPKGAGPGPDVRATVIRIVRTLRR